MDELRSRFPYPIAGGSVDTRPDAGSEPGEEFPVGEQDVLADAGVESPADGTGAGEFVEFGGKRYPSTQIEEALEALQNRQTWQKSLKDTEMSLADFRKTAEYVFGKPLEKLADQDLADLAAFGTLYKALQRDSGFRRRWYATFTNLVDEYEQQGANPKQAERAAVRTLARAEREGRAPEAARMDPELVGRLDRVERWASAQTLEGLQGFTEDAIGDALGAKAQELAGWHDDLREDVINRLSQETDEALVRMMYDGRLSAWIPQLVDWYGKRLRKRLTANAKTTAAEVDRGKTGALPPPVKGGPPAPAREPAVPVRGRGLRDQRERFVSSE